MMMMMIASLSVSLLLLLAQYGVSEAFQSINSPAFLPRSSLSSSRQQAARQQQQRPQLQQQQQQQRHGLVTLSASTDEEKETEKAAPVISGEELEMMMQDWELPLVVDAYATWCGPCLLMAPEFEAAAQELKGKVRFCKLDTDVEEAMASRLNIMGLPTLLFLTKYEPKEGEEAQEGAKAVLKARIEGALRKKNILDLCEHHFFGGPAPQLY